MLKPYSLAEVQFQLIDEIGAEGNNSRVFTAHDPQLGTQLIIKKIEKIKLASEDEFFTESSLLHKSAHTNVVPIHYACQDDSHIYLAMPYFSRGSLKSLLAQRMLSVREIVVLGTQFLSGLHHIHSKQLIHFDVKPNNILVSPRGEAVLSDFGLAKQTNFAGIAGQDRIYGSMSPPEAFQGDQFTNKLDIYQSGLTLYRMSVGDTEFYRQYNAYIENGELNRHKFRHAIRNAQFPDTSIFPEHIPQRIRKTIKRCLETEPNERFSSAIEIVNELASVDGNILDWTYSVTTQSRVWEKRVDGKIFQLLVNADGSSIATRKIGNGDVRRIVDYCADQITTNKIRHFLEEH